ncbi:MAG: hypothetical protein UV70_C0006G0005 [Parcubacteria group bacterium GW2011_GWA2_43_13]|nr:MAG: hypothetical protein UV70_C0006G0005 [Parcubacteria group bacterium GW2011_GWA2_43_13]OGY70271.1 MAG: hypothetical protein A2986_04375 [Candidatus Jacksonbacteria bacterium RIFCSPLOWO2_01_FULL_44_13]HAZ16961.1 hypothetical protein [Candidatus Jacksonbacteria bacterium]
MKHIIIVEDSHIDQLSPITLTRKASQITIAGLTLETLVKEMWKSADVIFQSSKKEEPVWKAKDDVLSINARLVPAVSVFEEVKKYTDKGKMPVKKYPMIEYPWDVIKWNEEYCAENLVHKAQAMKEVRGLKGVYAGSNVTIDDSVVFDTQEGVIILDDDSIVEAFTVLRGPLYIGSKTVVRAGSVIGPKVIAGAQVKVGGEVAHSIIESFSNKAHIGFLGHSYVGSWVNMGGGSSTSNLKNTYGTVRMQVGWEKIDTGMQFLGSIIADYAKTAVNTALYTGKIIGVAASCYGIISENVPSFTHATPKGKYEFELKSALAMQERMFARRDKEASNEDKHILRQAFESTNRDRKAAKVKKKSVEF